MVEEVASRHERADRDQVEEVCGGIVMVAVGVREDDRVDPPSSSVPQGVADGTGQPPPVTQCARVIQQCFPPGTLNQDGTPMANAMLTLMQSLGLEMDSFGDSTGTLRYLSDV